MKKYYIIILSIVISIIMFCCSSLEDSSKELSVTITPIETTINTNDEFQLNFNIADVSDLFGVAMEIIYDKDFIEVQDDFFTLGNIWDGLHPITFTNNETVCLSIGIVLENNVNIQQINGSGTLFVVSFKGIAVGETSIDMNKVVLIDQEGNPVENFHDIIIESASIVINDIAVKH